MFIKCVSHQFSYIWCQICEYFSRIPLIIGFDESCMKNTFEEGWFFEFFITSSISVAIHRFSHSCLISFSRNSEYGSTKGFSTITPSICDHSVGVLGRSRTSGGKSLSSSGKSMSIWVVFREIGTISKEYCNSCKISFLILSVSRNSEWMWYRKSLSLFDMECIWSLHIVSKSRSVFYIRIFLIRNKEINNRFEFIFFRASIFYTSPRNSSNDSI